MLYRPTLPQGSESPHSVRRLRPLCGIWIKSFGTHFFSAPLCGDSDPCGYPDPCGDPHPYGIYIDYVSFCLALRHFFLFRPRFFSRALGFVSPSGHHGASLAMAEVRGTCSEASKLQVPTGSDSEHVERPMPTQTHVLVEIMSDGSCTS